MQWEKQQSCAKYFLIYAMIYVLVLLSIRDLEEIYRMSQSAVKVRLFRARQRVLKAFREKQAVKRTHALPRTAMARAS